MRLRILLEPHHGATYARILALAKATEEGGFDAFFRSDHKRTPTLAASAPHRAQCGRRCTARLAHPVRERL